MLHDIDLILTFLGGLTAALILGFITQKMKLSPIVGYLLAGIAVGPFTPGFVANTGLASQFAEMGVILLMFGVGLHFHLSDLLAVRKIAIPGAIVQIFVATSLGAACMHLFGWSWSAGIVFGIAISVASTVVLTRVLADHRALHTPVGHVAVGWLIVEDLFTVVVLVVLPTLFSGGQESGGIHFNKSLIFTLGFAAIKLGALTIFTLTTGKKLIPLLLGYVAETRSRELFTLTILVLALGIAVGSAKFFGVSMALGAFLAGMVVGQSKYGARAATEALPMRDAFAVLFFVSVGMLFDPSTLVEQWPIILTTLAIVLLGKPLAAFGVVLLLGKPLRSALSISVALAQIGEFSFILSAVATGLGIFPASAQNALVVTALISITLNPVLYSLTESIAQWIEKRTDLGQERLIDRPQEERIQREDVHRMVVVGYGPVGRTLCRILRDNGFEPVVIEMNMKTVEELLESGVAAVYGDAVYPNILEAAGIVDAKGLVIAASSVPYAEVVQAARELNPDIQIVTRSIYLKEGKALRSMGANAVFSGEGETALAMATYLMEGLGATEEQISQECARIRKELFV